MKISILPSNTSNQTIRLNRLKIKQNLKLKFNQYKNKNSNKDIQQNEPITIKKIQPHLKVLNSIGLVEKQYIYGQFEDAYELKEKIGQGAHATVYRCIGKSNGKQYAVKITKHGDEQLIQNAKVQYKILKQLNHNNVMKVESFYTDITKMTTYLVCELCNYPELRTRLKNRNKNLLSEKQATSIIISILQTLSYLHSKGVSHRDIKPQNILYDPQSKILKIIDFDCSKKKPSDPKFQMWTKTGSLYYQAPEYFTSTIYDEKVDLWAAGIIAYQLVTGSLPFQTSYYNRMIKMITEEQIEIQNLNISQEFKMLLKKLLEKDPLKRYSAEECLRLPLILKNQHRVLSKTEDDFSINLPSTAQSSPRSCTEFQINCFQQKSPSSQDSAKTLLKYCLLLNKV